MTLKLSIIFTFIFQKIKNNYSFKMKLFVFLSFIFKIANINADEIRKETKNWMIPIEISRSTSLIDHQDGSRSDSADIQIVPVYKTSFGTFSAQIAFTHDLRDIENTDNGLVDLPISYSYSSFNSDFSSFTFSTTPKLTFLIPASQKSTKRDDLITAISGGIGFSLIPHPHSSDFLSWKITTGLTLGRNFHVYEEDINGQILNKYSSNQSLNITLGFYDFELAIDYLHRSRMTYQNNIKESYAISEELNYSINDSLSFGIGHTNEASALKPNGYESNFSVIDENSSVVYAKLGILF